MNLPANDNSADLAAEQLRIFRSAARLLASSLEFEQTLANTISACLPALGDFGFFDFVVEDGVHRTARAHLDPETEAILLPTRWVRQDRTDMNLCALSTGKPGLQNNIDDAWYRKVAVNDDHLALLRRLAFCSMLTVPMRYGEELIGALTLFMGRSRRNYSAADIEFARELAALAAPVVVNVRLLENQRRAEAALRVSEERLRLATDAGIIGVWDWDIAANRATWSDRVYDLHGLPPGRFGGRVEDFAALVHPDDRAAVLQQIELSIRDKEVFSADYRTVLPDGTVRWLSTWAHLYRDKCRVATRMVGATIDISERKHIEERERRAAAEAIATAEANAKFRAFFEQGSYFAGVMALDGTVIEANRLCLDACGFTRDEVVGKKFWECGWWNRSPFLVEMIRSGSRQAAAGGLFRQETTYFIADGSERVVDLVLAPVTDDAGRVLFIAPTGIDITERKQVEERLRLLDEMSEATRTAEDPKTVMVETTRLLGEYLGATRCAYADLEPDNDRFTIRDDWTADGAVSTVGEYSLDLFGPRAAADMREGRTLIIRDMDLELTPSEGGDMFSAIGIKAIICCPLVKEGRLVAMMAIHQNAPRDWTTNDITLVEEVVERCWAHIERVRAMEALRKSEAHLASLFEQTAAGIAETDLGGRITSVNDRYCQIVDRSRDQIVGQTMQQLTHPDDLPRNLPLFENAVKTGEPFEIEKRYLRPDGSSVWVSTTVNLIRAAGGKPADSVLAIVLDITERKQAEERLHDADRRKDEFLAMLAHELRNPLAPIGAAAELLRLARLDEARVKQTSEIISRQVRHMTGLVDDLLDVSRVTRGLVALDNIELDMKRIVSDAVEQVRPLIEARRHRLAVHMPPEPAFIRGDKKRIIQVMVNLLNNAAKYTPEGGSIVFSMEVQRERVLFSVTDNGIGMTSELVGKAFELFTQAERTSDRSQGGLGIGLALVKSLVELHRGTVTAYSAGLGKGSTFTVFLPRLKERAEETGSRHSDAGSAASVKPLKIMVVDDNVDAARMLAMFLEALGHRVFVEHSSARALERARAELPDVCLLDIGLPDMDGNELARRLLAQTETAGATLVAVTGYGQEQDRKNALSAGFRHHFVKPLDTSLLAGLLSDIRQS